VSAWFDKDRAGHEKGREIPAFNINAGVDYCAGAGVAGAGFISSAGASGAGVGAIAGSDGAGVEFSTGGSMLCVVVVSAESLHAATPNRAIAAVEARISFFISHLLQKGHFLSVERPDGQGGRDVNVWRTQRFRNVL
jgi:hypothetical protein